MDSRNSLLSKWSENNDYFISWKYTLITDEKLQKLMIFLYVITNR
jgi:hypothetical protein